MMIWLVIDMPAMWDTEESNVSATNASLRHHNLRDMGQGYGTDDTNRKCKETMCIWFTIVRVCMQACWYYWHDEKPTNTQNANVRNDQRQKRAKREKGWGFSRVKDERKRVET